MSDFFWLNKEKSRYYVVSVEEQLPNAITLNYAWGSCNSNRGGKKNIFVQSQEEAEKRINDLLKRRKSRGYQLISPTIN